MPDEDVHIRATFKTTLGIVGAGFARPVRIYPNPTDGKIIIENYKGCVEIYDIVGQKIISCEVDNGFVDVSGLSSGLYFLKVGNKTLKVVKK
jgi:hypothetical protein